VFWTRSCWAGRVLTVVVIVAVGDRLVVRCGGDAVGVLAELIETEPCASRVAVVPVVLQPGGSLATEVWILLGLAADVRRRVAALSFAISLTLSSWSASRDARLQPSLLPLHLQLTEKTRWLFVLIYSYFWFQISVKAVSSFFWDVTQRGFVVTYRRFGTTHVPHLQGTYQRFGTTHLSPSARYLPTFRDNPPVPICRALTDVSGQSTCPHLQGTYRRFGTTHPSPSERYLPTFRETHMSQSARYYRRFGTTHLSPLCKVLTDVSRQPICPHLQGTYRRFGITHHDGFSPNVVT